jgi:small subunit ribosomal protein S2
MSYSIPTVQEMFKAGAHFGHRKNHTDARSHKYIFGYKNKVAVIDLEKTRVLIEKALEQVEKKATEGAHIIFVGTKLQVQDLIKSAAESIDQSYVIERWPGGLITNFEMLIKRIKNMVKIENDLAEGKFEDLKKKEVLKIEKDLKKAHAIFGGLKNLERKPGLVFVVDAKKENIAILEARKQGITVIGICDTNSNPQAVDFPIVANDDSRKTVEMILSLVTDVYKKNFKPKEVAPEGEQAVETPEVAGEKKVATKPVKKESVKKTTVKKQAGENGKN